MSEFIEIKGGNPLSGTVRASGAKNAVLPCLIASLLTPDKCNFTNVPALEDVSVLIHLLEQFGGVVEYSGEDLSVEVSSLKATEASYSLVKAMRASFWVLAPLLSRGGAARVALPGGDIIGARPVDMHLDALKKMGADIQVKHGVVFASAPDGLNPADIDLAFPSVGATHQVLMAAARTPGRTTLRNAAREPEVVALAEMLTEMGAKITGAGSSIIEIEGNDSLSGVDVEIIGDRIEAATYLLAGAASGGQVKVEGIRPSYFGTFLDILPELGLEVEQGEDWIQVKSLGRLKPISVTTAPFPGFATDLQALLMAALGLADGESIIEESIFEGRFAHAAELGRMGAEIKIDGRIAKITGVSEYSGAPVEANDIRAAACLVIAACSAEGITKIYEPHHIRRGYSNLTSKLKSLGASVGFKLEDAEDFLFAGC